MKNTRNIAFWVVLFLLMVALFNMFSSTSGSMSDQSRSFSSFIEMVDRNEVQSVVLDGEKIYVRTNDGT
ncbi:MAG: ATP-dependent metallopeptidase FtsH/Yme1/Tma family protein, partial [Paracoccaceae bacterium]|nr:ATP-dependent metallopeptidase FtsH/Yme1/Tma family protein [Paracoccaceae bacterium]